MELFFGIDVGKFSFDVHVDPLSESFNVQNNKAGLKEFIERIRTYLRDGHEVKLVVCEATGGYEKLLVEFLKNNDLPIHVAHANKVRNFAKAIGKLAKTDKLDAVVIADYARRLKPPADTRRTDRDLKRLQGLQLRRRQLLVDLEKEKSRLDKPIDKDLQRSIQRHIDWIKGEIKSLDKNIGKFIKEREAIKKKIDLITSIPGVGRNTAVVILTSLPEIESLENKQLSALVGVAPMNKDSGTKNGKRCIIGGRLYVRNFLYMATIAGIRFNHLVRSFYKRLRDKGKSAKVAIVAAMHKLLFIIKAVLQRQSVWVENLA